MATSLSLILTGIGLGLGAAVPLGPVNIEIARRTIRHGVYAGIALGCGAVTIDILFAILASAGMSHLMDRPFLRWPLSVTGIALCLFLAFLSLRSAWRAGRQCRANTAESVPESTPPHTSPDRAKLGSHYAVGLAMTGLNVYTWLWWFSAVPSIAGTLTDNPGRDLPMICIGVGLAASGWVLCFAWVLSVVRHLAGRTFHLVADALGGTMLLGFGLWGLWALWTSLPRPL